MLKKNIFFTFKKKIKQIQYPFLKLNWQSSSNKQLFIFSVRQPLHFVVEDWFLVEKLSKLVQHSIEHGLMQHFAKRTQNIIKEFKVDVNEGNSASNEFVSVTTDKLNFVFVIYLCGNGCAIMVFLGELMWLRVKRTSSKMLNKWRTNGSVSFIN